MNPFNINVKRDDSNPKKPWRLYNHDWPAGDRLIQHDGFPFTQLGDWTRYATKPEADGAAHKLSRYLSQSALTRKCNATAANNGHAVPA